jgi:hypothetical protein
LAGKDPFHQVVNLELFGSRVHTDLGFASAWGGFPVVVGFLAQAPALTSGSVAALAAATVAAVAISSAQRCLSTPARTIRRRTRELAGVVILTDGTEHTLDRAALLAPLERALRAMSWGCHYWPPQSSSRVCPPERG